MNATVTFLKNTLESRNVLERTITMNQHFPCAPYFAELQKLKADKLLQDNEPQSAFAYLSNAHCVSLRHAALNARRDKQMKRKCSTKSITQGQDVAENLKTANQLDHSFNFIKISYPAWLSRLPSEWTVVQISEIWGSHEALKMVGFGPPSLIHSLPKLIITRVSGGQTETFLSKILEHPSGSISGGSLLAEFKSILEGNRSINKDFRGSRDQYWKLKQEHHDQLKVLVDSLENWWLDYHKCLLVGKFSEVTDIQLVKSTTAVIVAILKKKNKIVTPEEEAMIELFISCHGNLSTEQLFCGIQKTLNLSARGSEVTEIASYLRKIEPELERLKIAKRNPVILVLDKVIQQLPWESIGILKTTPVSRIPSLHFLHSLALKHCFNLSKQKSLTSLSPQIELKLRSNLIQVDPKLAYYLVNPGQDLPGVQLRLQPILEEIWGKNLGLSGVVPVEKEIKESLTERDIFLYCGHGSGSKYFPNDNLVKLDCRAAPILMGCSSGQLNASGRVVDPTGTPIFYLLAGSPGLVGMLWEVTDVDCDRFTIRLLDLLLGARQKMPNKVDGTPPQNKKKMDLPSPPNIKEPELLRAVAASRSVTKNFLTGAAAVSYGLPMRALDFRSQSDSHR